MSRDDTGVHSLGSILVRMKAISRSELGNVLREQSRMSEDRILGELLLNRGLIDEGQLKVALHAQEGLRSRRPHVRALAAAELAKISSTKVVQLAAATRSESTVTRKKLTGQEHPAVTAEMLAANGDE